MCRVCIFQFRGRISLFLLEGSAEASLLTIMIVSFMAASRRLIRISLWLCQVIVVAEELRETRSVDRHVA